MPDASAEPSPVPGAVDRPRALVTGGSSGIGLAIVDELAGRGFHVLAVAEDTGVNDLPERVGERHGSVTGYQADLATHEGVDQLCEHLAQTGPPIAVAALNAGFTVGGPFLTTDVAAHMRLVDLNCRAVVQLARFLLPGMVEQGWGRLLLTSSIAGSAPGPYHASYAASKAFVHSFAEGLRHELRGSGVTVTSVKPGPTDTPIFDRGGMSSTAVATGSKDDPVEVAKQAVAAALAGRSSVVTGSWKNRVQELGSRFVPDVIAARVVARQTKPGTGR